MSYYKTKLLTKREKETLCLIIKGLSNEEIAKELVVSIHTIKAHIESIYRKFGVHNKVQAVIYAVKKQIININEDI